MRESLERIKFLQLEAGWTRAFSTPQMETAWNAFIEQCENSYNESIYEYENDIMIRDRIELLLRQEDLSSFPAVQYLAEQVVKLDLRFRALLLPVKDLEAEKEWWDRGVLKFAGKEYAKGVLANYGLQIEVR